MFWTKGQAKDNEPKMVPKELPGGQSSWAQNREVLLGLEFYKRKRQCNPQLLLGQKQVSPKHSTCFSHSFTGERAQTAGVQVARK